MLEPEVAAGKGLSGPWQVFQLFADLNALGGGTSRQLALPFEPGGYAQRAVGGILTGLVEPAHPGDEGGFQRVDPGLANQDEQLTELRTVGLLGTSCHQLHGRQQLLGRGLLPAFPQVDDAA